MLATLCLFAAAATPDLPPALVAELGRYRVAQPADFIATVRAHAARHPEEDALRGLIAEDFNGDGTPDYAVLAVDRKTREFRFVLAISNGNGYSFPQRRHYRGAFEQRGGIVYTAIALKPAGAHTWSDKLYSPLANNAAEREAYQQLPALALWRSVGIDPYGRPDDYEVSSLAYCREVFYYPGGKAKDFMVCQ
jgi:hypothetical protein